MMQEDLKGGGKLRGEVVGLANEVKPELVQYEEIVKARGKRVNS